MNDFFSCPQSRAKLAEDKKALDVRFLHELLDTGKVSRIIDYDDTLILVKIEEEADLSDYSVTRSVFEFLITQLNNLFPEGHKRFPALEQTFEQILYNYQDKQNKKMLPKFQLECELAMLESVEHGSEGTMKFPILKNLLRQAGRVV